MKKQLTFTMLALCAALISGASWAGPCAGGANPGPGVDCRGANLARVDLRETDLRDANLEGADLRGAYLPLPGREGRTNYKGANLEGAIVSKYVPWPTPRVNELICKPGSIGWCKW